MFEKLSRVPAFLLSLAILSGCAGMHGKATAGVTGSVNDPANPQFNVGGELDFAKRRHNSAGK